jgi:homoprotocatechuate degradation regulator HpaR
MLADTGLTEQQWRVLRVLSEYGPQDATKVSERACLLLPSLTRIVHTLNQKGLLTRRENLTDRRKQTLEITAAGQKILDDNLGETLEILASFKSKLGEENYEHLLDLLEKLTVSRV